MTEIILAAIDHDQKPESEERASGNEMIIFQDSADICYCRGSQAEGRGSREEKKFKKLISYPILNY